jgi:hypothetical protein
MKSIFCSEPNRYADMRVSETILRRFHGNFKLKGEDREKQFGSDLPPNVTTNYETLLASTRKFPPHPFVYSIVIRDLHLNNTKVYAQLRSLCRLKDTLSYAYVLLVEC